MCGKLNKEIRNETCSTFSKRKCCKLTTAIDETQNGEYNARSSDELQQHVQFASQIADLADKEQYDFGTILTGLAIAAASYLVDYTVDLDGNVKPEDLAEATVKFTETLKQANVYASEQVKQIIAAQKAAS